MYIATGNVPRLLVAQVTIVLLIQAVMPRNYVVTVLVQILLLILITATLAAHLAKEYLI